MLRFFSDLKIKVKLVLGFAVVLLLLVATSITSYWGLAVIGEDSEKLKQRTEVIELARDIDYEFLNLRRYAREYALTGDDADIKLANEWGKKVDEKLKEALKTVKDPDRLAKLRAAEEGIKTYLKHFEEAVAFKHEEEKVLAETMDPTGLKMRTTLDEYIAAAAAAGNSTAVGLGWSTMQQVLLLRLAVNKSLGRDEEALNAAAEKAFESVETAFAGLEAQSTDAVLKGKVGELRTLLTNYEKGFERAHHLDQEIANLVDKEMAAEAKGIAENITKVEESAGEELHAMQTEVHDVVVSSEVTAISVTAAAVALGAFLAWFLGNAIASGIIATTHVMSRLAEGDDSAEVAATERKDEIGQMTRALIGLRATVSEAFRLKQMVENMPNNIMLADAKNLVFTYANKTCLETMRKLGSIFGVDADKMVGSGIEGLHKDLGQQRRVFVDVKSLPYKTRLKSGEETLELNVAAVLDKRGVYIGPMLTWELITSQVRMATRVSEVVGIVSAASAEMQSTAQSMSATAEETSKQAAAVAAASEEAATNVQTVAAATEELSSSISEIGRQVLQSSSIAAQAVSDADKSNKQVQGLADAAQKIGEVVSLINDIASQTNLLALNATIEAARAGDAGKGFAVVASEVKSLANQTAKATEEIGGQIANVQAATQSAVAAIRQIGERINELAAISTTIAAAVEEQGAATKEISGNVAQAASGTQEVNSNITGVNAAASQTGQAAGQVLAAAGELSKNAEALRNEIKAFIGEDKAA